jgi:hypothetical protein
MTATISLLQKSCQSERLTLIDDVLTKVLRNLGDLVGRHSRNDLSGLEYIFRQLTSEGASAAHYDRQHMPMLQVVDNAYTQPAQRQSCPPTCRCIFSTPAAL